MRAGCPYGCPACLQTSVCGGSQAQAITRSQVDGRFLADTVEILRKPLISRRAADVAQMREEVPLRVHLA